MEDLANEAAEVEPEKKPAEDGANTIVAEDSQPTTMTPTTTLPTAPQPTTMAPTTTLPTAPQVVLFPFFADSGVAPRMGSYNWIKDSDNLEDRELRRDIIRAQTLNACDSGGYRLDTGVVTLATVTDMEQNTRVIRSDSILLESVSNRLKWYKSTKWSKRDGSALDVARQKAELGKKVAVVSAASAYQKCGGFHTGGRHALEESICVQTTLSKSIDFLQSTPYDPMPGYVEPRAQTNGEPWQRHIPDDGVVLTPNVAMFRDGSVTGYPFLPKSVYFTIISLAMPNANRGISDAPMDKPEDEEEYKMLLNNKFSALVKACLSDQVTHLVIDSPGCGVYQNDPKEVGRLFGKFVREKYPNTFIEICLLGRAEFQNEAVAAAVGDGPLVASSGCPCRELAKIWRLERVNNVLLEQCQRTGGCNRGREAASRRIGIHEKMYLKDGRAHHQDCLQGDGQEAFRLPSFLIRHVFTSALVTYAISSGLHCLFLAVDRGLQPAPLPADSIEMVAWWLTFAVSFIIGSIGVATVLNLPQYRRLPQHLHLADVEISCPYPKLKKLGLVHNGEADATIIRLLLSEASPLTKWRLKHIDQDVYEIQSIDDVEFSLGVESLDGGCIPSACRNSRATTDLSSEFLWRIQRTSALRGMYSIQNLQTFLYLHVDHTTSGDAPGFGHMRGTYSNWHIKPLQGRHDGIVSERSLQIPSFPAQIPSFPAQRHEPAPAQPAQLVRNTVNVNPSNTEKTSRRRSSAFTVVSDFVARWSRKAPTPSALRRSEREDIVKQLRSGGHGSRSISAMMKGIDDDIRREDSSGIKQAGQKIGSLGIVQETPEMPQRVGIEDCKRVGVDSHDIVPIADDSIPLTQMAMLPTNSCNDLAALTDCAPSPTLPVVEENLDGFLPDTRPTLLGRGHRDHSDRGQARDGIPVATKPEDIGKTLSNTSDSKEHIKREKSSDRREKKHSHEGCEEKKEKKKDKKEKKHKKKTKASKSPKNNFDRSDSWKKSTSASDGPYDRYDEDAEGDNFSDYDFPTERSLNCADFSASLDFDNMDSMNSSGWRGTTKG